jgi:hypothetical protein
MMTEFRRLREKELCICKYCDTPFERTNRSVKYCSVQCSTKSNKEITQVSFRRKKSFKLFEDREKKICEQCKYGFFPHVKNQRFCCRMCSKSYDRLQWINRGTKRE